MPPDFKKVSMLEVSYNWSSLNPPSSGGFFKKIYFIKVLSKDVKIVAMLVEILKMASMLCIPVACSEILSKGAWKDWSQLSTSFNSHMSIASRVHRSNIGWKEIKCGIGMNEWKGVLRGLNWFAIGTKWLLEILDEKKSDVAFEWMNEKESYVAWIGLLLALDDYRRFLCGGREELPKRALTHVERRQDKWIFLFFHPLLLLYKSKFLCVRQCEVVLSKVQHEIWHDFQFYFWSLHIVCWKCESPYKATTPKSDQISIWVWFLLLNHLFFVEYCW